MCCHRSIVSAGEGVETNPDPKAKRKTTLGRRKIPIRKIEDKNKKQVTFSKRRKGLFSKARELCVLCGADVAIITFSEAGKVFTFGHPTTDSVIGRYLHGGPGNHYTADPLSKRDGDDRRRFWWDRSVDELGLEELETFAASLERLRSNVQRRIGDLHELDRLEPLMPVKNEIVPYGVEDLVQTSGMACGMNDSYWNVDNGGVIDQENFDWSDFDLLPSPDREFVQDQYQSGFDGGIGSIVAMAEGFNSN